MKQRIRFGAATILVVAGLVGAVSAPALADTTIGQTGSDQARSCSGADVYADASYVVPAGGGTITSFSFQSFGPPLSNAGQQLDFLVLRPAGGTNYTAVGKSGLKTLAGTGLETFPTSAIPVQGGDILGFWTGEPGLGLFNCTRPGAEVLVGVFGTPDPSVGTTFALFPVLGFDLNESAHLVTGLTGKPDCKNGGWQSFGFKNQGQCVMLFGT
jgi:hypothetical protein